MWLAALGLVGLLLRVLYAFTLSPPLPATGDDAFYYYTSNLIAQGNGYSAPETLLFTGHLVPTALHPPLWPAAPALFSLFTAPGSGVGMFGGFALDLHVVVGCACWRRRGSAGRAARTPYRWLARWSCSRCTRRCISAIHRAGRLPFWRNVVRCSHRLTAPRGVRLLQAANATPRTPSRGTCGARGPYARRGTAVESCAAHPAGWRTGTDRRYLTILAVLGTVLVVAPWTARNYAVFGALCR